MLCLYPVLMAAHMPPDFRSILARFLTKPYL